jgi:hypothetical protein
VVVATALVPALEALQSGLVASRVQETLARQHHQRMGRMEEVLAQSVSLLAAEAVAKAGAPSAWSDPPGTPDRLLVVLSLYDADDADKDADRFTGGESDLVWVQVGTEATPHVIESLATP